MPSFFNQFEDQIEERLNRSNRMRSETATALYNYYGEPDQPLDPDTTYWRPWMRQADFSPFRNYRDFSDDMTSLILKPYVLSALAAYEVAKLGLCLPGLLTQVIKGSPTGCLNKAVDAIECLVATTVLTFMASLELYLQIASLVIRLGATVLNGLGCDVSSAADPMYYPADDAVALN